MYPYVRVASVLLKKDKPATMTIDNNTVLNMRVWLADIDVYPELNNGRHLTLMDLGRYHFGKQVGLFTVLKKNKWGLMVAGNFTRFRRRIKLFQKFTLSTKLVGYDDRWFYFYQVTSRQDTQCSAALVRTAITDKNGLVSTEKVVEAMKLEYQPTVPDWVEEWIELNKVSPPL